MSSRPDRIRRRIHDRSAAEVLADRDIEGRSDVPQWILKLREQPAGRVAVALGARRLVRFECPKCGRLTVTVDGTRWECELSSCKRSGDSFDLVARALFGVVYFRLTPGQRAEVRQWAERYLEGGGAEGRRS